MDTRFFVVSFLSRFIPFLLLSFPSYVLPCSALMLNDSIAMVQADAQRVLKPASSGFLLSEKHFFRVNEYFVFVTASRN